MDNANPGPAPIDFDRSLTDLATQLAIDIRLRDADTVSVALAHRLGLPLVTRDQERLTRASGYIDARTPSAE